jgi:hypothetical protein
MAIAPIENDPVPHLSHEAIPIVQEIGAEVAKLAIDIATHRYYKHSEYREEFRGKLVEAVFDRQEEDNHTKLVAGLWAKGLEYNAKKDATTLFIKYPFRLCSGSFSQATGRPETDIDEILEAGQMVLSDPEAESLFVDWLKGLEAHTDNAKPVEIRLGEMAAYQNWAVADLPLEFRTEESRVGHREFTITSIVLPTRPNQPGQFEG